MKKTILPVGVAIFTAFLLSLSACSSPKPESAPPTPSQQPAPEVKPGETGVEGHVEPSVPEKKEGASLVPATVYGKIAAEAVPMAPVEDLVAQVDEYVGKIGTNLTDLDGTANFKNDADAIIRDANALTLVALAVGTSGTDSKYKKAAPGIIKAALELEKAEKLDDAKKAFDNLKAALTSEGDPSTLAWTKVAELTPLMKAVPNLSATLTRLTNAERKLKRQIEKEPQRIYGALAALAAISQGSIANVKDTTKPDAEADWKKVCEQFRDCAIKANAAAHGYADGSVKYDDYWAAFKTLTESCDKCHEVFYPTAVGKNE